MSKIKQALFLLGLFLFFCGPVRTEAATISVAGTKATAVVGGTVTVKITIHEPTGLGAWEFNVDYDSSILSLTSGQAHVVDYVQNPGSTSKSYTYTFKVKKSGTASVSIASSNFISYDEATKTSPKDHTTIECISQQEIVESYSKNNNLKSLEVEGYSLTPSFHKDTLEYQLEVENEVNNIHIKALQEDGKASVSGTGEKEVHEGSNSFDIVVTAENGSRKTYKLTVTVKELNPVKAKIGKKEYMVIRKKEELTDIPKHFEETKVKIKEEEVLAYKNDVLDLTLVALKDEKGKIAYYIYKNGNYRLYQELTSGNLSIHLLDGKKKIPKGYKKYQEKRKGIKIDVYKQKKKDDFFLVYGENVETGKKGLYVYDSVENTLQRYNEALLLTGENTKLTERYIILGLFICLVILLIISLILLNTRNKRVKKNRKERKKEREEFLN